MYKYHFHSVIVLYKPITGVIMAPEIAEKNSTTNPTKRTFSRFSLLERPKRITASKITIDRNDVMSWAIVKIKSAVPYSALDI